MSSLRRVPVAAQARARNDGAKPSESIANAPDLMKKRLDCIDDSGLPAPDVRLPEGREIRDGRPKSISVVETPASRAARRDRAADPATSRPRDRSRRARWRNSFV